MELPAILPVHLHGAVGEDARDAWRLPRVAQVTGGRWPFVRGQSWPEGSRGSPQSGHGGRPASTRRVAWMAKAAACSRVRAMRSTWPLSLLSSSSSSWSLLEHHDDPVELLVVGDADGSHHPLGLLGAVEAQVLGQVAGASQLLDDAAQVAGQDGDLLLLDLDGGLGRAPWRQ